VRELDVAAVAAAIRDLCVHVNYQYRDDHLAALDRAIGEENSALGCEVLRQLRRNGEVASAGAFPICQDTGYAVCFLRIGQDVHFTGGALAEAVDRGVREGYRDGYLRASLVRSPIDRTNTGDNTPAMLYTDIVPGDGVEITLLVKGAGCDNMSAIRMLTPAEGVAGMMRFVVETIERAGPSASPPLTVGIGMGGTFDMAARMSKWALTRTSGQPNADPAIAELETSVREAINRTGIGPAGFGGTVTALAVHIESMPTHIAAFPVAINLDCHSHRVGAVTL
jgi:fumarate hydratase subunit alpha